MASTQPQQTTKPNIDKAVLDWLLDSDPSIRWQVMQDLIGAPAEEVAVERSRVATEGLGAQLLTIQETDGSWGGVAWNQGFDSTMHVLTLLLEMGLDPASPEAQRAISKVRDHVQWIGWDWDGLWKGMDFLGNPYFAGEVEPCINGQVGAGGAYFGQDISRILNLLLKEQLADGGWNCEAENGSTRGSFNTTICVLEALLEYELANPNGDRIAEVKEARFKGQEYMLERHLLRRLSTGEIVDPAFTQFAFPNWWHYDILRGLDYLRKASVTPDDRVAEAISLVESKRTPDGRWLLDNQYPGNMPIDLNETVGQPSRWITLRALRVLNWYATRD